MGDTTAQQNALLGTWGNMRRPVTAAYSVSLLDKGWTIACEGSAFYAVTVGAASGFDANFQFVIVNEDTGRAKWVSVTGGTSFFLWPLQSVIMFNQNGVWYAHGRSRWKVASGTITVNADFTNGSDTAGVSDGLSTGASAFKSIEKALSVAFDQFDFTGDGQTVLVISVAQGTTDTQGVHFSAHAFVGAQGGGAIRITGAGSGATVSTTGVDALGFFCNVQIQVSNLTLQTTTGGNCLNADLGAQVYILGTGGPVVFGSCAGSQMVAGQGARIYRNANYTVSGGATTAHMQAGTNGIINGGGLTVTVSNSITVGWWALASNLSAIVAASDTYTLGGHTVTGKLYEVDALSLINTGGGGANYFPGTVAGTVDPGSVYE